MKIYQINLSKFVSSLSDEQVFSLGSELSNSDYGGSGLTELKKLLKERFDLLSDDRTKEVAENARKLFSELVSET